MRMCWLVSSLENWFRDCFFHLWPLPVFDRTFADMIHSDVLLFFLQSPQRILRAFLEGFTLVII